MLFRRRFENEGIEVGAGRAGVAHLWRAHALGTLAGLGFTPSSS